MRTHDWHRDSIVINWYSDDGKKKERMERKKEKKERRKRERERERERGRGDKYCFPCAM